MKLSRVWLPVVLLLGVYSAAHAIDTPLKKTVIEVEEAPAYDFHNKKNIEKEGSAKASGKPIPEKIQSPEKTKRNIKNLPQVRPDITPKPQPGEYGRTHVDFVPLLLVFIVFMFIVYRIKRKGNNSTLSKTVKTVPSQCKEHSGLFDLPAYNPPPVDRPLLVEHGDPLNYFERSISDTLCQHFKYQKGVLINSLKLGNTECDHVLVTDYILAVIESKNYSGYIDGSVNVPWTCKKEGEPDKTIAASPMNPYNQVKGLTFKIKNGLEGSFYKHLPVYGFVVFPDEAEICTTLKKNNDDNRYVKILKKHDLAGAIEKNKSNDSIIDVLEVIKLIDEPLFKHVSILV